LKRAITFDGWEAGRAYVSIPSRGFWFFEVTNVIGF